MTQFEPQQQHQSQQQQSNPSQMLGNLDLSSILCSVGGMNGLFSLTLR